MSPAVHCPVFAALLALIPIARAPDLRPVAALDRLAEEPISAALCKDGPHPGGDITEHLGP